MGRKALEGNRYPVRLTDDELDQIAEYATTQGITGGNWRADALRELILAGLNATPAAPAEKTIWDLFPEIDPNSETADADLYELASEYIGDSENGASGDQSEYEWNGHHFAHGFDQIRGTWVYHRQIETRAGHRENEYTLTASRKEAAELYRQTMIEYSKNWDPTSGKSMWADCGFDGDIAQKLYVGGHIPEASLDASMAKELAAYLANKS